MRLPPLVLSRASTGFSALGKTGVIQDHNFSVPLNWLLRGGSSGGPGITMKIMKSMKGKPFSSWLFMLFMVDIRH
jgi:hypothetical protein